MQTFLSSYSTFAAIAALAALVTITVGFSTMGSRKFRASWLRLVVNAMPGALVLAAIPIILGLENERAVGGAIALGAVSALDSLRRNFERA